VVISNLVNRGTVLLNYRLGDIASISKRECTCGRTLSLLSELEGRVEDILYLPNGKFVHPRAVWSIFKTRYEVLQYQLIQKEPAYFELRIVTKNHQTYKNLVDGIAAEMKKLLGGSATIEARYYEHIERQKGGKFRSVMSRCKPEELR